MKNEAEIEEYFKCFVPYCSNNSRMTGKALRFFQLPAGVEGFYWKKAVNNARKKQYERMIELLKTNRKINLKSHINQAEYCCEVHFNIETDIEQILYEDGSVAYTVKQGKVPSIQAVQQTRLDEFDFEQLYNKVMNQKEDSNLSPKNEFVSLVDISTFTKGNSSYEPSGIEQQLDIKSEPMMPLTVALMKKKSVFYTGLQQSRLTRLLCLTVGQTSLTEVMIMLTLRKLRLNEDLEVLGDLFDVDKTTAEQYFEDSKGFVLDLSETLTNVQTSESTNSILTLNNIETTCNSIKLEPMNSVDEYIDEREFKAVHAEKGEDNTESDSSDVKHDDDDPDFEMSSLESTDVKLEDADPNFDTSSLESTNSSEYESDSLDEDLIEPIEKSKSFCPICGVAVLQLSSHIQHVHRESNINKTICGLCLKNFLGKTNLKAHQQESHSGNAYSCDICGHMAKQYSQIRGHMFQKHAPRKDILCEMCGESFPYQHKLTAHVQRKHLRIRNHECNLCDKKYLDRLTLEEHINAVHTGARPYKCEVCGKSFARKHTHAIHKNVHSESRYSCNVCDKQFSFKNNLKTHRKNIHGIMI